MKKEIDSLIQTLTLFSKDKGMQFGIDKRVLLVMRIVQVVNSKCIQLPDDRTFKSLKVEKRYKCLKVLESERVLPIEMKAKFEK